MLVFVCSIDFAKFLLAKVCLVLILCFRLHDRFAGPRGILVRYILPTKLTFSLLTPLVPRKGRFCRIVGGLVGAELHLSGCFLARRGVALFKRRFRLTSGSLGVSGSCIFTLVACKTIIFILLVVTCFFAVQGLMGRGQQGRLTVALKFLVTKVSRPFLFGASFGGISLVFIKDCLLGSTGPVQQRGVT